MPQRRAGDVHELGPGQACGGYPRAKPSRPRTGAGERRSADAGRSPPGVAARRTTRPGWCPRPSSCTLRSICRDLYLELTGRRRPRDVLFVQPGVLGSDQPARSPVAGFCLLVPGAVKAALASPARGAERGRGQADAGPAAAERRTQRLRSPLAPGPGCLPGASSAVRAVPGRGVHRALNGGRPRRAAPK